MNNLRRIIDIVDENILLSYDELKTLLQKELGSSFANIGAAFNFAFDTSIKSFQSSRKLAHAMKEILNNPEIKLSDLAIELNYNDQSAFTNAFKSEYGITPGQVKNNPSSAIIPDKYALLDLIKNSDATEDTPIFSLSVSQLESLISKVVSKQFSIEKEADLLAEEFELSQERTREAIDLSNNYSTNLDTAFRFIKEFDDEFEYSSATDEDSEAFIYTECFIKYGLGIEETQVLLDSLSTENVNLDDLSSFVIKMMANGFTLKDAQAVSLELEHYTTEDGESLKNLGFPEYFSHIYVPVSLEPKEYINKFLNETEFLGDIYRDGKLYQKYCELLPEDIYLKAHDTPEAYIFEYGLTEEDIELVNKVHDDSGKDILDCYKFVSFIKVKYDDYPSIISDTRCYRLFKKFGSEMCFEFDFVNFVEEYPTIIDINLLTTGVIKLSRLFSSLDLLLIIYSINETVNKKWEKLNFYDESEQVYSFFKQELGWWDGQYKMDASDIPEKDVRDYFIRSYLKAFHLNDINNKAYDLFVPDNFSIDDYWDTWI